MASYHFTTRWLVEATCEEVYDILGEADDLPRWWPSVYLDVQILKKGQPGGLGKEVSLLTKGWLPYKLRWQFRVTAVDKPKGFSIEAWGDFVGTGVWTFRPSADDPRFCEIIYDWDIDAEKPLLKKLTWLLRPAFSANHEWAMRKGEESLRLELLRHRARLAGLEAEVPPPPRAVFA